MSAMVFALLFDLALNLAGAVLMLMLLAGKINVKKPELIDKHRKWLKPATYAWIVFSILWFAINVSQI